MNTPETPTNDPEMDEWWRVSRGHPLVHERLNDGKNHLSIGLIDQPQDDASILLSFDDGNARAYGVALTPEQARRIGATLTKLAGEHDDH